MPRKNLTDLITDREMAFARLVLGGTMNDRDAAQAAGLNPDSAASTKSKPCVRQYMLAHRAAVEQQLVAQQAEAERQLNLRRERFLGRLWAIADTSAETTKGSFTSQIKALSMIGAMDGFIPDRRSGFSSSPQRAEKESTPPPVTAKTTTKPASVRSWKLTARSWPTAASTTPSRSSFAAKPRRKATA